MVATKHNRGWVGGGKLETLQRSFAFLARERFASMDSKETFFTIHGSISP